MLTQLRIYLFAAATIAFLDLGGTALWYRRQAISAEASAAKAKADLVSAVEANRQAAATIDALQEQARLDGRLTASLVDEMRKISADLAAQASQLTEPEKQMRMSAPISMLLCLPI